MIFSLSALPFLPDLNQPITPPRISDATAHTLTPPPLRTIKATISARLNRTASYTPLSTQLSLVFPLSVAAKRLQLPRCRPRHKAYGAVKATRVIKGAFRIAVTLSSSVSLESFGGLFRDGVKEYRGRCTGYPGESIGGRGVKPKMR
jgi:hypothetical protein